jgi:hypothetical protein
LTQFEQNFELDFILSVVASMVVHMFDRTSVRIHSNDIAWHLVQMLGRTSPDSPPRFILNFPGGIMTVAIANHAPIRTTPTRAPATQPPLRLTRRGKAVVVSFTIAAVAAFAMVFMDASTATQSAGSPVDTVSVRVMPGATLWQIASEANPHGDVRDTITEIVKLNALTGVSDLQVGQTLAIPVY